MEALMASMGGGGGGQANSALLQAQKAREREATQLQPFYLDNILHNNKQVAYIRSVSLALAGSTAGILGLSSSSGLLFFLFSILSVNAAILLGPAQGRPQNFLLNPPPQSPLGFILGIGSSVATAAAIASPGLMAYGASAVLGGSANSANARGVARVQKVVGGTEGEDMGDVAWYLLEGLKGELLSFVLWWTFWTAIVHVYE